LRILGVHLGAWVHHADVVARAERFAETHPRSLWGGTGEVVGLGLFAILGVGYGVILPEVDSTSYRRACRHEPCNMQLSVRAIRTV